MCTSFVLYEGDKTFTGMNFDISDRPIKLALKGSEQLIVYQQEGGRFLPAFGFTASGTSMNLLMVEANEAGQYRRGKGCVHIIRLFDEVLDSKVALADLDAYLADKTVVNVPGISVHSLVAGVDRQAIVVEPGRGNIPFDRASQDFMLLTNFPLVDFVGRDVGEVRGAGAERYRTGYNMLCGRRQPFTVDQGMAILQETAQPAGNYPTQLSMLAAPDEGIIHFWVQRDFSRRYTFHFVDWTVRVREEPERAVTKKGLLLSELVG